jgi:hypothetical protein
MSTQGSCPDREKIFQLVHRLLEPPEESDLRRHVLHCEKCLLVARDFEKFDEVLGEWKDQTPSPWFDQRLKQKLPSARPARAIRFFALPSTRIFAAALLVMIVVAGAYVVDELPKPGAKPEVKTHIAEVQKPAAAQKTPETLPAEKKKKTKSASKPLSPDEELKMYQNMGVLENLDLLEGFDVLSDLPRGEAKNAH